MLKNKLKSAKESLALGIITLMCSCASTGVKVESSPEGAEVSYSVQGEPSVKAGVTPLELDSNILRIKNNPVFVSVYKSGYKRESVLLPASVLGQESRVLVTLIEDSGAIQRNSQNFDAALDEVARGVAKIQELVRSKEYDQALSNISSLLSKYPNLATLYGLQGNIYYIQKNIEKALSSYRKAEAISPSIETQKVINKIEGITGGGSQ
jgi:hypothetical protein